MPQKYVTQAKETSNRAVANNALAKGISMSAVPPLQRMESNNVHIGPAQERHLPHEAWHVAQQERRTAQKKEHVRNAGIEKKSFSPEQIEAAIRQALSKIALDPAELARVIKVIEQMENVSLDASQIDQRLPLGSDKSGNDAPVQRAPGNLAAPAPAAGGGGVITNILIVGLILSIAAIYLIYTVYQRLYNMNNYTAVVLLILALLIQSRLYFYEQDDTNAPGEINHDKQ